MLNISGLNEGIVLDHIQAGKSLKMQEAVKWAKKILSRLKVAMS